MALSCVAENGVDELRRRIARPGISTEELRELLRKEMLRNGLDECCMETERHR